MFRSIPGLISFFSSLFVLFIANDAMATHNRAGEITYKVIGGLTIEVTITTYTKSSSVAADRDTLDINWGDGNTDRIGRINGNGTLLPNDTKVNYYVMQHTYAGQARYTISMTDPNRNAGILNVNSPASDMVPFHLQTTVTFFNPIFQGPNNSPILTVPPIDIACVDQPFLHNPGAFDPDGDSLAYRLIVPLQDVDTEVPNYKWPYEINTNPPGMNIVNFDESTGDFYWNSPQVAGEYNIAMFVIQFRAGVAIDTLIRDMQILVEECDNMPPEIETIDQICVIAGEIIELDVVVTAPSTEPNQKVDLIAFGAPFEFNISPATLSVAPGFQNQPLTGVFRWETKCEHIADQFYTVIFRAADNFPIIDQSLDTLYLSTLKMVRIKVVGPPPEDVQAVPGNELVEISWANPYFCEDAAFEYFRGFTVWRKENNTFILDTCDPGLSGKGYKKLTSIPIQDILNDRYFYQDNDVERGRTYCYRVQAEFARISSAGFEYNWVEGLASDEVCVQLSRDIPLITNVSVLNTDANNGEIYVRWSKPDPEDLDTLQNPGPYTYELLRANGITDNLAEFQPVTGASFTSEFFTNANDTIFNDTGIDTETSPYSYIVAFYINDKADTLGYAASASSVFLNIASTDEINNLSWDYDVPWDNSEYIVYRLNASNTWDSIATTTEPFYSDQNLINGRKYCYYVRTEGTYGIPRVVTPLFNNSQEACGIPLDTIPPCPPILEVTNICDEASGSTSVNCEAEENLVNSLDWINPMELCQETDDVVTYNIYFSSVAGGEFELIETITNSTITEYEHKPDVGIAGCYAVTAVDTFFNESKFSNIVCVDNCPIYNLPNVFTPNGDGSNDLFVPFPYCFVDHIEMAIYNRWGELVHETTDPNINWDGKNLRGEDLAEGVYYYSCTVFEQRVSGIVPSLDLLSGYIQLIRGK